MRAVADQLQGASTDPSSNMGVSSGIRLSTDPPGWGPPVPASQQFETAVHKFEGDQLEATDVTVSLLEKHQNIPFCLLRDICHEKE